MASAARNVIVSDLSPRTFVESVDFMSGAGYGRGPGWREQRGLPSQGPWRVVTDLAVFEFDASTGQMALLGLFPGVSRDEVAEKVSFPVLRLDQAPVLDPPTEQELRVLREGVDPRGILLHGKID
jgi:glutaconate CoA-transferase subunit B